MWMRILKIFIKSDKIFLSRSFIVKTDIYLQIKLNLNIPTYYEIFCFCFYVSFICLSINNNIKL